jgi:hypothetical protein
MKNKWRIFLFLAFFVLVNGFGQQNTSDANSELLKEIITMLQQSDMGERTLPKWNLVPLTMDIVKLINNKNAELFEKLDFYLSSDLTLTIIERNVAGKNGGLVIDSGNTVQITKILRTSKGKCDEYDLKNNEESFIIKFEGYEHILQFKRNLQTNRFDFYAIDFYSMFESPRPYLCIFVDQKGEELSQRDETLLQSSQTQAPFGHPAPDQFPVLIMGSGKLNAGSIVSYIVNKGSTMNKQQINALVSLYIREAQVEGINHDIAIAQMCYATNFLNNQQLLNTFNYAGLNTDMGISFKGDGKSHLNDTEGVRAHIQHIKGYASTVRPIKDLVDSRYNLLITSGLLGKCNTLEDLFKLWSPYNAQDYGHEIRKILNELFR